MTYRNLTEDEVLRLKSQSCLADDWGKVTVAEEFSTEFVHHTRFSGEVRLGVFHSEFTLPGGIKKHSGLRHVTLHNVTVGDNCCIENIQNYIANYEIGHDTFIENVDIILVDGLSRFGNSVEVSVLNETGGREVLISDKLSAHQAYIMALYRHRPELIARMKEITDFYSNKHASATGSIGSHVMILNTGLSRMSALATIATFVVRVVCTTEVSTVTRTRLYISGTALFAIILSYRPVRMWMMEPCLPVAL